MEKHLPLVVCIAFIAVFVFFVKRHNRQMALREAYIRNFNFPKGVLTKVYKRHGKLSRDELELASLGLRHFFLAYHKSGYQPVAMPSQIVDDLWHEFILYTQTYQQFCQQAFGQFLHHQPAEVLTSKVKSNQSLRRVWYQSCKEEGIDPLKPVRLPLLFALDARLAIAGGFYYMADCGAAPLSLDANPAQRVVHCGADFANPALFGTDSASSGSCGGSGCGGGHGGCSGGCGGGCGGD